MDGAAVGAATVLSEPTRDEERRPDPPADQAGVALGTEGRPPGQLSDLVARAQGGDELAFARLVRAVRERLYRWALVKTGDPDDAEDVTQDAILKLQRALPAFDGRSRVTTWLYTIVRTTAADLHRSRARRAGLLAEAARNAATAASRAERDAATPTRSLDRDRLTAVVLAFFDELPERQREVFDLCDLQGHGPTEVADMLGIEPVSVRGSLFKARRTLRARILEEHPELVEDR